MSAPPTYRAHVRREEQRRIADREARGNCIACGVEPAEPGSLLSAAHRSDLKKHPIVQHANERAKAATLADTIAEPGAFSGAGLKLMACHETTGGNELPCVGWLVQQLGPGNNIALRLRVIRGDVDGNVQTEGPQHATLAATLRRRRR